MVVFKDLKFHEKRSVMKTWRYKILSKARELLADDGFNVSESSLRRYVEYLLEDTHYNVQDNVFYEPISHFKFTVNSFAQITYDYVLEHLDEFKNKR